MQTEDHPEPAVSLSHLSRLFGATPAIAGVDLTVAVGQVVVLRGANGAGKSTLLRLIATELSPTFGRGKVVGFELERQRSEIRKRVASIGHRTRLYADLTVEENLRFWTRLAGPSSRGPDLSAVLTRVGLLDRAGDPARELSQGMRQRLSIAIVTRRAPDLLLMDEPYAGLDEEGKEIVDMLVRDTCAGGRTVILASHDRSRPALADREIWLSGGRIVADEPSLSGVGRG